MNKKRTLKGFTLLELIIVMALFSVIMMMVMSFVDPVSGIMKKTSVRERTAAYADNISDYISKSVKYAKFVRVFDGGFCDKVDNSDIIEEDEAVKTFASDFFEDIVNKDFEPIEGKIHVLRLLNTPDDGSKKGTIQEAVYTFKAGDSIPMVDYTDITNPVKTRGYDSEHPETTVAMAEENKQVINPEHFEYYSFYYKLGYNTFDAAGNVENSVKEAQGIRASEDCYYSKLNYQFDTDGNPIENKVNLSKNSLAVSIISYLNNTKDGNRRVDIGGEPAFISPSYMMPASMSFPNVSSNFDEDFARYYRKKQTENVGDDVLISGSSEPELEPVKDTDFYGQPFSYYEVTGGNDNIYFIYAIPTEIDIDIP